MIGEKFFVQLENIRLGDRMYSMLDSPCYKVPSIWEPNGHLYCSWIISDLEAERTKMTVHQLFDCYTKPAMLSMAEKINKHDVCLCAPLPVPSSGVVWSKCYEDEAVPIRITASYDSIMPEREGGGGHRFTLDVMADLLTKGEL